MVAQIACVGRRAGGEIAATVHSLKLCTFTLGFATPAAGHCHSRSAASIHKRAASISGIRALLQRKQAGVQSPAFVSEYSRLVGLLVLVDQMHGAGDAGVEAVDGAQHFEGLLRVV